jgi:hypothetical protein
MLSLVVFNRVYRLEFLSMSQQSISVDIIPNSAVGIFSPKTEGTKTESEIAEMSSWDQANRGERQEN